MFTKEKFYELLELYTELTVVLFKMLPKYCEAIGDNDKLYSSITCIDDAFITIEGDNYVRYSSPEHHELEIPSELIYDPQILAKFYQDIEAENKKRKDAELKRKKTSELRKKKKADEKLRDTKKKRKAQYEKLKEEFENE